MSEIKKCKIIVLIGCLLLGLQRLPAQTKICEKFNVAASAARTNFEEVTQEADVSVKSPEEMISKLFSCLAVDKSKWFFRLDTVDRKGICQLYSSDSLYGWIGFDDLKTTQLIFKLKKFSGTNPVSYSPARWTNVMQQKRKGFQDVGSSRVEDSIIFDVPTNSYSVGTRYCEKLSTLLHESQFDFRNVSLAYRHNATITQNYSSQVTIQQNFDNNYIQADGEHRFLRYTEIIDDKVFFESVKNCLQKGDDFKGWKKAASSPGTIKYIRGLAEFSVQQNKQVKNAGAILIITKKLSK